jgi:hypothetical protein
MARSGTRLWLALRYRWGDDHHGLVRVARACAAHASNCLHPGALERGGMIKISLFRCRQVVIDRVAKASSRVEAVRARGVQRFASDLRDLHDAIAATDLDGHYWMWAGLLLGWAREGAILPHDYLDADFAVRDADFDRLVRAVPAIRRAGFACDRKFMSDSGLVTELTFTRRGARFDFFRMFPDAGRLRYFIYSLKLTSVTETECSLPDQPTEPFTFLGRTWRKHADHARELRSIYGKWEVPDPSWSFGSGLNHEAQRISRYSHSDFDWRPSQVIADVPGASLPSPAGTP